MSFRRLFILLPLLFSFWFSVTPVFAQSGEIGTIDLSKTAVNIPLSPRECPPELTKCNGKANGMSIVVTTSVTKFRTDDITYQYVVSGGQIVGSTAEVIWDLRNVHPGTYTIHAEIRNKSGISLGTTNSRMIDVLSCVCGDCICPFDLSVSAPDKPVKAGDSMVFSANTIFAEANVTYNWTISNGKLIEGQGTPSIKVATTPEMAGEKITATVKIGGPIFCPGYCIDEAFAVSEIESADQTVDVESITFDEESAIRGCEPLEPFLKNVSSCFSGKTQMIIVTTKISETGNQDLDYYYTVSGGEILGKGANVIWDLGGSEPGTYTINVGVGRDFVVFGKTLTKSIESLDCMCDRPCECPVSLTISGPAQFAKGGDLIVLKAEAYFDKPLRYDWKVSNGTIVAGQGTSQILVEVDSVVKDSTLGASLEVSPKRCDCGTLTASKNIRINKPR